LQEAEKIEKIKYFDSIAHERDNWKAKNKYYYQELETIVSSVIPPHKSVLEIGCSTGDLLAAVRPRRGVGVDISSKTVDVARRKYPQYEFLVGDVESLLLDEEFDYVLMSDLLGYLDDIWEVFHGLHKVCHADTVPFNDVKNLFYLTERSGSTPETGDFCDADHIPNNLFVALCGMDSDIIRLYFIY